VAAFQARHGTAPGLATVVAGDIAAVAGHLTPVPGGVGPMTIAALLASTVSAAEIAAGTEPADKRSPTHAP
jgi:methylenetetrahydrofolate dehydrogenase (NADP+)/methenyltetrahydrofolate cyclohydrolase